MAPDDASAQITPETVENMIRAQLYICAFRIWQKESRTQQNVVKYVCLLLLQKDNERRRRISRLRRIQRGEDVSDDEYEASSNPADDAYLVSPFCDLHCCERHH